MKRAVLFIVIPALVAGCGTDVSGPGASLYSCLYSAGTSLEPGDVQQVAGGANQGVCVSDGAAGAYLYVPFYARASSGEDSDAELPLLIRGIGLGGGGTSSALQGTGPVVLLPDDASGGTGLGARLRRGDVAMDWAFHSALREREIRELGPRIRSGAADPALGAGPGAAHTALPVVGDLLEFNTAISCTDESIRTGRVEYISEHAVVVADVENASRQFTPQDYAYFGVTFDTLVYPVETAHFGSPTDIDGNGRAILFFTRAVNELNSAHAASFTIGFFWSGDLFPDESTARLEACPAANNAEMFYLIAPDPTGAAGPRFTVEDVRELAIPLIGHEFQHLVNASRRLFVNNAATFEDSWLNEGLSHIAEELLFYEVAGLQTQQNLDADAIRAAPNGVDAFNEFMSGNLSNFGTFMSRPDTASLMGPDDLATRGATWAFLRYAADRTGQGDQVFFRDVVNSRNAGLDNLGEVLGPDEPLDWMQDWTVSIYADDFVDDLDPRYTVGSWDFRGVFEGTESGRFPLRLLTLDAEDGTAIDLLPGGTAFTLFELPPDGRGVLHVESEGKAPPAALRGSILRVQ